MDWNVAVVVEREAIEVDRVEGGRFSGENSAFRGLFDVMAMGDLFPGCEIWKTVKFKLLPKQELKSPRVLFWSGKSYLI